MSNGHDTASTNERSQHAGVVEINAVLARVDAARLAGRALTARTSYHDAFDRILLSLSTIGDARRYLGEFAIAATGLARAGYVPLTREQLNDAIGESVAAEEAIVALLQTFVEADALRSVTQRGGGGVGVAATVATIHELAQRAAVEESPTERARLVAQLCLRAKRLRHLEQRGPTSVPLDEHYDLPALARAVSDLVTIWKRWKAARAPIPDVWDAGLYTAQGTRHADGAPTLRPTPVEVACRLIAQRINAVEARNATRLQWGWASVRAHVNARKTAR